MGIIKKFLEISQATNPNGRRNVKIVLHEIYPDATQWNENGISYLEQYTRDNADSIKGMPLCAEFLDDDREIPYGHGLTGYIKSMPVFEDSVQVGIFENWSIEDLEIGNKVRRCLCATGYINEGRYPKFVKWIEDKLSDGETIRGSVEFVGTKENDGEIIYDGGWKEEGRIPMVYDYSGYCILSVKPSDSAAVLIELNQLDSKKQMEVFEMNEEMNKALSDLRAEIISEFKQTRNVEVNEQVSTLEAQISELNSKIEELNKCVQDKEDENSELNKKCEQCEEESTKKEKELSEKVEELNAVIEEQKAELCEMKKTAKIAELNQSLSAYTEEEKGFAKDEIEAFTADPFSVEINSITTKIESASYRKIREAQNAQNIELNSKKNEFDGIMANVDPIHADDNSVEEFDCFA